MRNKALRREYDKRRYEANKDEILKLKREDRLLFPEKHRQYQRKSRAKHREKVLARDRDYKRLIYDPVKALEQRKDFNARHPEKAEEYRAKYKFTGASRRAQIKSRYGVDIAFIERLLEAQNGKCPICLDGFEDRQQYIDHCHESGRVRGIVHMQCNTLMGLAGDNPDVLQNAANYIKNHQQAAGKTAA